MRLATAIVFAVLIGLGFVLVFPAQAQQPSCGVDVGLTDAQLSRHQLAIGLARHINTAEVLAYRSTDRFQPLQSLVGIEVRDGFEAQLLTDGANYTFSIKDGQDVCKFAVFSDQTGVLYTAHPMQ